MRREDEQAAARGDAADVVVIGGGPAGSATALHLARRGWRVIQLERRVFLSPANDALRSGEGLIPRTRRELAALGIATAGAAWVCSEVRQLRLCWLDGARTEDCIAAQGGIVQIDREQFDWELFGAARAGGVDGREGWQVRRLHRDARGRVAGVIAQPPGGGPPRLLAAAVVVDAGGRNALALRELDLRRRPPDGDFFAMAMFFDRLAGLDADVWEMHCVDPRQTTIVQLSQIRPGLVRVGLGAPLQQQRAAAQSAAAFFWSRLHQAPELARRLRDSRVIRRPFVRAGVGYQVRGVAFDGLLLVGDAAGYISPVFGDGIYRALRAARDAATTIDQALRRGDCSRAGLARYARRHAARACVDWGAHRLLRGLYAHPRELSTVGQLPLVRRAILGALLRG